MSRVTWVDQPELGGEADVVLYRRHGCASATAMRRALGEDDVDELEFPIGIAGRSVPGDIPFVVTATNPCGVCGSTPSMWAAWRRKLIL